MTVWRAPLSAFSATLAGAVPITGRADMGGALQRVRGPDASEISPARFGKLIGVNADTAARVALPRGHRIAYEAEVIST